MKLQIYKMFHICVKNTQNCRIKLACIAVVAVLMCK